MTALQAGRATAPQQKMMTAFICANCARAGIAPAAVHPAPTRPAFDWPLPADEIVVPCTGRLQPEHLLKVFEAGSCFVCVIACQDGNCHYGEGCRRADKRMNYVRGVLDQIGLGGERLALFHLPGSAREDMALGANLPATAHVGAGQLAQQIQAIREEVTAKVRALAPNPLYKPQESVEEISAVEETDDNED